MTPPDDEPTTSRARPWEMGPARPALGRADVHVWRAWLDARGTQARALRELLAPDEKARADRFYFEQHRLRFTVARGLLRTLAGRYLDIAPSRLNFTYNAYGKPSLDTHSHELRFNVSHSEGLAVYAFARGREVGVDVEFMNERVACEGIAARFFAPAEAAALGALPETERARAFFNCWTRKEAYIKARGEGLSLPLDGFEVSLAPGEPCALVSTAHDPAQSARWTLRELEPAPGYVGTVAAGGRDWRLHCWRLEGET